MLGSAVFCMWSSDCDDKCLKTYVTRQLHKWLHMSGYLRVQCFQLKLALTTAHFFPLNHT